MKKAAHLDRLQVENTGVEPVTFPHFVRDAPTADTLMKKAAHLDRLQVENTGVEPVTSCMPCKPSSQLS